MCSLSQEVTDIQAVELIIWGLTSIFKSLEHFSRPQMHPKLHQRLCQSLLLDLSIIVSPSLKNLSLPILNYLIFTYSSPAG